MKFTNKKLLAVAVYILLSAPKAFSYNFSNISRVSNARGNNLDFNFNNKFDFNGDGINDRVRCSLAKFVTITSGADQKVLFEWDGPQKLRTTTSGDVYRRAVSGCEITMINSKTPVILISNFWITPNWRSDAPQYAVFRTSQGFVVRTLEVSNFGTYRGVVRSIKCGRYPRRMVTNGYKDGALCFMADYTQAELSRSAILKLEMSRDGNDIIAKDLSSTSGLLWSNGARGTSIWNFDVIDGFKSHQRDGGFMMDSAFLDYNNDGLIDFLTVGQHAKLRSHRMVIDSTRREGIRFVTNELTSVNSTNDMTEFLKITSFDRQEPNLDVSCVYLSGESSDPNGHDHIRCFRNGTWSKRNLPINFSSEYYNARIRVSEKNTIIIKTRRVRTIGEPEELTFEVP